MANKHHNILMDRLLYSVIFLLQHAVLKRHHCYLNTSFSKEEGKCQHLDISLFGNKSSNCTSWYLQHAIVERFWMFSYIWRSLGPPNLLWEMLRRTHYIRPWTNFLQKLTSGYVLYKKNIWGGRPMRTFWKHTFCILFKWTIYVSCGIYWLVHCDVKCSSLFCFQKLVANFI